MASINDLATAATIASSAVALRSPKEGAAQPASPSSPQEASSPPSPSPSAQLQAQAQEAHAQQVKSASKSPVLEGVVQELDTAPDPAPSTSPIAEATAVSFEPDSSNTTVNPGVSVVENSPPVPSSATPRLSPEIPPRVATPPTVSAGADSAPVKKEATPELGDAMDGVEYEAEQKKSPVRGAFLVFEGMDRAGKTTQAKLLQLRCIESGRQVKYMRFPDRTTPIGKMIDSYLKGQSEIEDHVIHLLFSANRWEAARKIEAELEAGHTIICDRFYHSGIVYSAAKQLPSLSLSWAKAPEVGLPRPDMVLFLDLEESVARSRGGWGGEVYEKGEMQRRVRELFWGLSMGDLGNAVSSSKGNGRGPSASRSERINTANSGTSATTDADGKGEFRQEEEDIHIMDADLGVEELADKVWDAVRPRLEAVERGEEGKKVRIVR